MGPLQGSNPKTTLYVGGLEETVNEAMLHAAFLPFGEIKDVNIPMDHASGKHRCAKVAVMHAVLHITLAAHACRGFGFVEVGPAAVQTAAGMH